MTEKLKPCPFCGGKAKISNGYNIDFNNRSHEFFFGICLECGGSGSDGNTEEEATEKWNRWWKYANQNDT